jgi:hypothetical protein
MTSKDHDAQPRARILSDAGRRPVGDRGRPDAGAALDFSLRLPRLRPHIAAIDE